MKYPKSLLLLFLLVTSLSAICQTLEFEGRVKLSSNLEVYKIVTVPNCPQKYVAPVNRTGTSIKYETKLTNDKTDITITDIVNSSTDTVVINANKQIKFYKLPNSAGKANLYLDEKDKSKLYVNYYLNAENKLDSGTKIIEWTPVYHCSDSISLTSKERILKEDETHRLMRVEVTPDSTGAKWFKSSARIDVLDSNKTILYYLVDKFDRNAKYILELENRESIAYWSPSVSFGALTIPFKYRFGYSKQGIEVKDDVEASINIGVYAGYKLTKYHIINKAGTYKNQTLYSFRFGPFINLSSAALDSVSTTAGKIPMKKDDKQNIAVLSTGLGFMGDLRGIQIGVYGGLDLGVGSAAKNWNYHKRFWLGLGVGYKITDFFAKKE